MSEGCDHIYRALIRSLLERIAELERELDALRAQTGIAQPRQPSPAREPRQPRRTRKAQ